MTEVRIKTMECLKWVCDDITSQTPQCFYSGLEREKVNTSQRESWNFEMMTAGRLTLLQSATSPLDVSGSYTKEVKQVWPKISEGSL